MNNRQEEAREEWLKSTSLSKGTAQWAIKPLRKNEAEINEIGRNLFDKDLGGKKKRKAQKSF